MLALSYSPDLSIVSSLIVAAGPDIVAAFENPTYPFTFLAPVNSAFKGVDLAALKANNALLRQVLGNHILWQYSFPKDLLSINGLTITTLTSSTKVSFKAWSDSYGKVHASVSGPLPKCTVGKFLFKRYSGCQVVVQPITAVLY